MNNPRRDELGGYIYLPYSSGEPEPWSKILRRDPCAYCGGPGGTVDHIVPLARGGEQSTVHNGTGACSSCNSRTNGKADRPLLHFLLRSADEKEARRRHSESQATITYRFFTDEQVELLRRLASDDTVK